MSWINRTIRRSLMLKLMLLLVVSAVLFFFVYHHFSVWMYESFDRYTQTKEWQQKNLERLQERLQAFADERGLRKKDMGQLTAWEKMNPYANLTIFDGNRVIYITNLPVDALSDVGEVGFDADNAVDLRLEDGWVKAVVYDYQALMHFEKLSNVVSLISAALIFFTPVAWFIHRKMRQVRRLYRRVNVMGSGDFDSPVVIESADEIGRLAAGINEMRVSIKTQRDMESTYHQAAYDLVTAMSHDLRTPLTGLMGYVELMKGKTEDQDLMILLTLAQKKCEQMKSLQDKLFEYFYAFSVKENAFDKQRVSAQDFFAQALFEKCTDLETQGFSVDAQDVQATGDIAVHPDFIMRVLDNVFQNVLKHGDSARPVTVEVLDGDDQVTVSVTNGIAKQKSRESTKVGQKTCQRIMAAHHGSFATEENEETYTARLTFPKMP